jgi:hypothetical protein
MELRPKPIRHGKTAAFLQAMGSVLAQRVFALLKRADQKRSGAFDQDNARAATTSLGDTQARPRPTA